MYGTDDESCGGGVCAIPPELAHLRSPFPDSSDRSAPGYGRASGSRDLTPRRLGRSLGRGLGRGLGDGSAVGQDAAAGAAVGTAVPVIGTAIGGAIGAIVGLFTGSSAPTWTPATCPPSYVNAAVHADGWWYDLSDGHRLTHQEASARCAQLTRAGAYAPPAAAYQVPYGAPAQASILGSVSPTTVLLAAAAIGGAILFARRRRS